MKQLIFFIFSVMSCLVNAQSGSQLVIVEDKGGISVAPYFNELGLLTESLPRSHQETQTNIKPITVADMLPVRSQLLSPGVVQKKMLQVSLVTPFFLIGEDERSKNWLRQRQKTLLQINAIGMVVNVETPRGLEALRALAPELTLIPVSGDDIAKRFNIQHYPVLVTVKER